MEKNLTERFPALQKFDISLALELGWKGYAQNVGIGALIMFLGGLLAAIAIFTGVGFFFALPHLAVGMSLTGYYMAKGPVSTGALFSGFRRYGTVLGTMLVLWLIYFSMTAVFSGPYYYHLSQAMAPEGEGTWLQRFVAASLNPEVQNWAALQYLAYPFQFYLQGRFLPLFPLIVDEGASVGEAFANSWRMTGKQHGMLCMFMFLTAILTLVAVIVGMLGLIVGMFFTLPFPMAMIGAGTRQLMEALEINAGSQHEGNA